MLIFGGFDSGTAGTGSGGCQNDVWALSLSGSPSWSKLSPVGTPPLERYEHTAIYDAASDRMLVFGGQGPSLPYGDDTWVLSLAGTPTWSELSPAGPLPSGRLLHTAIYDPDPAGERMLVFGGNTGVGTANDVWALSLSGNGTWSQLSPSGTPPSSGGGSEDIVEHTAIYDPARNRMVVFGGYDGLRLNRTWALSLSGAPTWSELSPGGFLPASRNGHTSIYDPARDRMVVFGGDDGITWRNDTWALDFGGPCGATAQAPPPFLEKWGSPGSADGQFAVLHAVAAFAGNVYVAEGANDRIQRFDRNGAFLTKWGSTGAADGQFDAPNGVATDANGNVYVADSRNNRIQKFTGSGTFITKWGSAGSGDGQFNGPAGVATDANGNVYVADNLNNRIQKFTGGGTFITKWGSAGSGDGQFNGPVGVATDANGSVYVADYNNNRVQTFDSSGSFIGKWGVLGSGDGEFYGPYGIAIGASSVVYVADNTDARIQVFTACGSFLGKWGSAGSGDGQFQVAQGVAVDASGNVYVADSGNQRIQKFGSSQDDFTHPCTFFRCIANCSGTPDPSLDVSCSFDAPAGQVFQRATTYYVAPLYHCSDASADLYVGDQFIARLGPVAPGGESQRLDISALAQGMSSLTISLRNVSCQGGCCTSGVESWGGTIVVTGEAPPVVSGVVQAQIVSRSDNTGPALLGLSDVTVSVRRGTGVLNQQLSSYPMGAFSLPAPLQGGEFVRGALANDSLIIIDDGNASSAGCRLGYTPLLDAPADGSAPVTLEWPSQADGASSDAAHAMFYAVKVSRDYWLTRLNITPWRWIVHVNALGTGNGNTAAVPEAGWICTGLPTGAPKYPEILYHELGHRIIQQVVGCPLGHALPDPTIPSWSKYPEAAGMDEGFADYFAASFRNDSRIHDPSGRILRDLDQLNHPVLYTACAGGYLNYCQVPYTADAHSYGARLFGGALWDLRSSLVSQGQTATLVDRWFVEALKEFVAFYGDDSSGLCNRTFLNFRKVLEGTGYGKDHLSEIGAAFDRHNISAQSSAFCFPAPVIRAVNVVKDNLGQTATVIWNKVAPAQWHRVYLRESVANTSGLNGLGILVADSLADTTFTYRDPDTSAVLAFVVTAVDSGGVEGPASAELPAVTGVRQDLTALSRPTLRAYPNPGRGMVTIAFAVPRGGAVRLGIYDVAGRLLRTLSSGNAGPRNEAVWDGRDQQGRRAGSGVYFVRLDWQAAHLVTRILLLR